MSRGLEAPAAGAGRAGRSGILAAAAALFGLCGYDAVGVRQVAAAAGLEAGSLYHHYPSKEALLAAALVELLDGAHAELRAALAGRSGAVDRLAAALYAHVRHCARHPEFGRLVAWERRRLSGAAAAAVEERVRRYEGVVTALLAEGVAAGDFRPVHIPLAARRAVGLGYQLATWYRPEPPLTPDFVAGDAVRSFLRSLGVPDELVRLGNGTEPDAGDAARPDPGRGGTHARLRPA